MEKQTIELSEDASPEFRKNFEAYQKYKTDKEWLDDHSHKYVGFVNGIFVGDSEDRDTLSSQLTKEFPDDIKFITKVGRNEEVEDIPSLYLE